MPKFSQIPTNNSPAAGDFLIGVSSGGVDQKTTLTGVKNAILPQRTRRVIMQMGAEESGGATTFNNYGKEVKFATGVAGGYARAAAVIPRDYVPGTSINVIFMALTASAQSIPFQYYVEGLAIGGDGITTPWNIASAIVGSNQAFTAKLMREVTLLNIASGSVSADKFFGLAFKPNVSLSAELEILACYLEYQSDI